MLREHVRKPRPRVHAPAAPAAPAARVGRLTHVDAEGVAWVTADAWLETPERAVLAAPPPEALESLVGRRVLLVPLENAEARVAVLGWITEPRPQAAVRRIAVDGERIVISAERELELRCGEACLTLSADGCVRIKGKGILNHAREVNRIRGGQVRIN